MKWISKNTLNYFDWFLIIGSLFFYLLHWWLVKNGISGAADKFSLLGAIAGMSGLICNVLCAKRSISNYIFGLINVSLYAYIAWQNRIYGDVALNLLYYLPMQFIGFFMWQKNNEKEDTSTVVARKLDGSKRLLLIFSLALSVLLIGYLLSSFTDDPHPYKDSATTVISIVAMLLMVAGYTEQWWLWIIVNIISTIMWVYLYIQGGESGGEMIIKWFFNLANSINGYIVWNRAYKRSMAEESS